MRRLLTILGLTGLAAFVVVALGAGGSGASSPSYWVQLDNAFGLVVGGDMKVAGVRAGKIADMRVDQRTHYALIKFQVTRNGFGSMRADTTCQVRPQSLIGEYFLDCQPGTAPQRLREGGVIPVTQTSSVVAPDLVNDIMRTPYRDRFRIILNEFGAATAGNARNLAAAIRRGVPALDQTDKVLEILGRQNQILANLARDGDKVIGALAGNRKDVARWVVNSNKAATISASRERELAAQFQKLPGFLAELRPAMEQLGKVAENQTPALRTLDASAHQLTTFFNQLAPFSQASTPAFKAFGQASVTGNEAVQAARPTVAQLDQFAQGVPELGKNLAVVLQHLDDPQYATEADPRSPGGRGFTGLQDLINYTFWQSTDVNLFDQLGHVQDVSLVNSQTCDPYPDPKMVAKAAKEGPSNPLYGCINWLGPNQPGITTPDPTAVNGAAKVQAHARKSKPAPAAPAPVAAQPAPAPAPRGGSGSPLQLPSISQILGNVLSKVPQVALPKVDVPSGVANAVNLHSNDRGRTSKQLLDYLLAP